MVQTTGTGRGPGSPRDPETDRKIREATWKLIASHGYGALTFEAIAQAVGCSRTTLYRRYASKSELVTSMFYNTIKAVAPIVEDDADPREMLITLVLIGIDYLSGERGAAFLNVASIAQGSPELARVVDSHLAGVAPYYISQLKKIAPNASDDAIEFTLYTLIGSFLFHVAIRRQTLTPRQIGHLVDQAIALAKAD